MREQSLRTTYRNGGMVGSEKLAEVSAEMGEVMQTSKQRLNGSRLMATLAQELAGEWRSRLLIDCPDQNPAIREGIIDWLLGEDLERFDTLSPSQLAIAKQAMDYRWRILQQRYLGVRPERAYRNLTTRLGSLVMLRNKIRTWVALSRDRQQSVADVLQEVLQELLHSDRYMQQQIAWISRCTKDERLKEALVLTSLEEYCLRPVRNQPILIYRFVNYLRRSGRSGMTHVPERDSVRLVSAQVNLDETDSPMNLLDSQAIAEYQDNQAWEEQLCGRTAVKREFEAYLAEKVSSQARDWLRFYLQGLSQEAIAREMNLSVQQIYRLREKVSYHAVRVFALKTQPELVAAWLSVSLRENNLGLTPKQWQKFWETLTPEQCQLVEKLKAGCPPDAIAKDLGLKTHQVMGEWSKLYLAAQALRSDF